MKKHGLRNVILIVGIVLIAVAFILPFANSIAGPLGLAKDSKQVNCDVTIGNPVTTDSYFFSSVSCVSEASFICSVSPLSFFGDLFREGDTASLKISSPSVSPKIKTVSLPEQLTTASLVQEQVTLCVPLANSQATLNILDSNNIATDTKVVAI